MDEGVDVDACPCAPRIKHHRIEDAAVVGGPAEAGQEAPHAVGQMRGPDLGPAQVNNREQEQEEK